MLNLEKILLFELYMVIFIKKTEMSLMGKFLKAAFGMTFYVFGMLSLIENLFWSGKGVTQRNPLLYFGLLLIVCTWYQFLEKKKQSTQI